MVDTRAIHTVVHGANELVKVDRLSEQFRERARIEITKRMVARCRRYDRASQQVRRNDGDFSQQLESVESRQEKIDDERVIGRAADASECVGSVRSTFDEDILASEYDCEQDSNCRVVLYEKEATRYRMVLRQCCRRIQV